jgi:hypothetical protein
MAPSAVHPIAYGQVIEYIQGTYRNRESLQPALRSQLVTLEI